MGSRIQRSSHFGSVNITEVVEPEPLDGANGLKTIDLTLTGARGFVQKLPKLRNGIHFPLESRIQLNQLIIYGNLLFSSKLAG